MTARKYGALRWQLGVFAITVACLFACDNTTATYYMTPPLDLKMINRCCGGPLYEYLPVLGDPSFYPQALATAK